MRIGFGRCSNRFPYDAISAHCLAKSSVSPVFPSGFCNCPDRKHPDAACITAPSSSGGAAALGHHPLLPSYSTPSRNKSLPRTSRTSPTIRLLTCGCHAPPNDVRENLGQQALSNLMAKTGGPAGGNEGRRESRPSHYSAGGKWTSRRIKLKPSLKQFWPWC